MEELHLSNLRLWISPKISMKKFRNEWCDALKKSPYDSNEHDFREKLAQSLGISNEEVLALDRQCNERVLDCPDEDLVDPENESEIPDDIGLKTLWHQKNHLEKKKTDNKYRSLVYNSSKLNNFPRHIIASSDAPNIQENSASTITHPEIVLLVQLHRPEKRCNSFQRSTLSRAPTFHVDQEFLVLGSQTLTELRDKIDCVSDMAISGDYSEDPTVPADSTCKDLYKSGFFYIDGIFFNDMRDPDCRDYSQTIMKWSEENGKGIGPFFKEKMEKTKFIDLQIQLGYPYVYMHQGSCEHLLIFSDLRMLDINEKHKEKYPMYVSLGPKKRVFCRVCHLYTAVWVVYDNKRLPENPFYFCAACFYSFNYTADGEKEGEFRAYHFPDRTVLT